MSRIQLNESIPEALTKLSEGNPGAITVLLKLYTEAAAIDPQDFMGGLGAVLALDTHQIYGPDIWVLFKDICGCDIVNVCAVLRAVQLGILPESSVKAVIADAREGRAGRDATQIHVPTVLEAVMAQLAEFNRPPQETTAQPT